MGKLISIFFLCFTFVCTSCNIQTSIHDPSLEEEVSLKETVTTKICFTRSKDPKDLALVNVQRRVPKGENIIDATLKELFLGPTKREMLQGIMTEIPVGTRLIKIEESEDAILVDLSSQYLVGGGAASVQLRYLQLYRTLKSLVPKKKLYLHVDGKNIKAIAGEGLEVTQPLSAIDDYTKTHEKSDDLQP
ncbi:MAG: GerMN domain-containing protein [Candidatus Melainabacteria bacterium]|nr:GerMN domain-containing protein [Candidatus Melainabacteria bacterium]